MANKKTLVGDFIDNIPVHSPFVANDTLQDPDGKNIVLTDDSRLSNDRNPTAHSQAYTTITGLGDAATKNVGSTTGTVAAGDDQRLSDARTPTAHSQSYTTIDGLGNAATKNVGTGASDVAAGDHTHLVPSELSYKSSVLNKVEKIYDLVPDVTLTTTGADDLNNSIAALTEGQLLEIKVSATFNPITIPGNKGFMVRAARGYAVVITGQECIKIMDGAKEVILSGVIVDTCTSSYSNGRGSAITFGGLDPLQSYHAIARDIIFHNITVRNAVGSGVMLSYNDYSDYAFAPTLAQMSKRISFIDCDFYKATTDKIEGASLALRGVDGVFIYECYVDSQSLGRGISVQDCINVLIEQNNVVNCNDGNGGEGIKVDEIGTMIGYRNTAIVRGNIVKNCIEGIDIDDTDSCFVFDNTVFNCSDEAISVDDSATAVVIGNICYNSGSGIRLENNSIATLKKNNFFNNTTNYLIENGYVVDDSNSSEITNVVIGADSIPYKNTTSGLAAKQLQAAVDEIKAGAVAANAGITGATYPKITYDTKGLVTGGASLADTDIPNISAAKITSGTFDIARIPAAALERLVPVANQAARFSLTTATVHLGDTVKENDTGLMYIVIDEANLNNSIGYQVYTAGSASVSASCTGNALTSSNATTHIARADNPHATNATQVGAEPTIATKNTAFNKNYEATATNIKMNGAQAVGSLDTIAHGDHVHPVDTSRETANSNIQTHIAVVNGNPHGTTAAMIGASTLALGSATPLINGVAAVGNSASASHENHVHPVDTSREMANSNIQAHIALTANNPHGTTAAMIGAASTATATTSTNGLMSSTDKVKLDGLGGATFYRPFTVSSFIIGKPASSSHVLGFVFPFAATLPQEGVGSFIAAGTGATGAILFTLYKNSSIIGTIYYQASATIIDVDQTSFAIGDAFRIVSNGQDTSLANVDFSFLFYTADISFASIPTLQLGVKYTFFYTGALRNFVVPAGASGLTVKAWGAGGGSGGLSYGGGGGFTTGTLPVTPAETLSLAVGGGVPASGGGGFSGIKRGGSWLLIAPGGGAGGGPNYFNGAIATLGGGAGGGLTGIAPVAGIGGGGVGTQSAGGAGGTSPTMNSPYIWVGNGSAGGAYQGGNGYNGTTTGGWNGGGNGNYLSGGGGGGGGFFGGGGGGASNDNITYSSPCSLPGGGGSALVPSGGSTTAGSGTSPGNSGDTDRLGYGTGQGGGSHGIVVVTFA